MNASQHLPAQAPLEDCLALAIRQLVDFELDIVGGGTATDDLWKWG